MGPLASALIWFNVCASGDVSLMKLGVSEEEYLHLSSEVGRVFTVFSQKNAWLVVY